MIFSMLAAASPCACARSSNAAGHAWGWRAGGLDTVVEKKLDDDGASFAGSDGDDDDDDDLATGWGWGRKQEQMVAMVLATFAVYLMCLWTSSRRGAFVALRYEQRARRAVYIFLFFPTSCSIDWRLVLFFAVNCTPFFFSCKIKNGSGEVVRLPTFCIGTLSTYVLHGSWRGGPAFRPRACACCAVS